MTYDARDEFISRTVAEKTFADIGGLWGLDGEKISVAARSGASDLTLVDEASSEDEQWVALDKRLRGFGVHRFRQVSINTDAPNFAEVVGVHDVVHCSGVLYHCPNPVHTLFQLRSITSSHLILTSMVVPSHLSGPSGELDLPTGASFFVPYLPTEVRTLVCEHYAAHGVHGMVGLDLDHPAWSPNEYRPWWWLFTVSFVHQLLGAAGFDVLADAPLGCAHTFLAEPNELDRPGVST